MFKFCIPPPEEFQKNKCESALFLKNGCLSCLMLSRLRACLSTFIFDRKCAVETKYSDLIGRDFNYRSLFRRWLRSRPIRSGFLFSTSLFRSEKIVLRHALRNDFVSTTVRFWRSREPGGNLENNRAAVVDARRCTIPWSIGNVRRRPLAASCPSREVQDD